MVLSYCSDLHNKECMKCKKNLAQVVIRNNDAFCQ